jgi:hypothetical protein
LPLSRWARALLIIGLVVLAAEAVAILLFGWAALPGLFVFLPFVFTWKTRGGEGKAAP